MTPEERLAAFYALMDLQEIAEVRRRWKKIIEYRGVPRSTRDVDAVIFLDDDRLEEFVEAVLIGWTSSASSNGTTMSTFTTSAATSEGFAHLLEMPDLVEDSIA